MRDSELAERLLSLVITRDRAASIVGDLLEDRRRQGSIAFWMGVVRTSIAFIWRDISSAPARYAALLVAAYLVSIVLYMLFFVLPQYLIHRPYDDSLLSAFWIRETAYLLLSDWALRTRMFFLNSFVLGLVIARISPDREVAACSAIVASNLIIVSAATFVASGVTAHAFATLAWATFNQWPLLLAGVLVRWRSSATLPARP